MLEPTEDGQNWRWAAFGKHPTAKDYFRLGEETPFVEGLFAWVELGYQLLTANTNGTPDFCSWRFWIPEAGTESLVCGVVRVSSDSLGRPYPLVIMGAGPLDKWPENWDLLPFASERTWRQIEYLGANLFSDLNKLEQQIHTILSPESNWDRHKEKRKLLNRIGSPLDPYVAYLDLGELKKLAAANADRTELLIGLDRGPCDDKIMPISLWHLLCRESRRTLPSAIFMGGTLDEAFLTIFRRPLKPADFLQLWSISAPGVKKNVVGTEYAMDLSTLGKQPISSDKPTGGDVRYDPAFDELQTEVDKLSSPAAAGSVSWEKVVRNATDILMNKSKDLLVASYLAVALIHTRSNDGFALGLKVYLELMEQFWEELYPRKIRMRGRVRALEWWLEKSEAALNQINDLSFPLDQLGLIKENLSRLDVFLQEHMGNAPSLAAIKGHFHRLSSGINEAHDSHTMPQIAAKSSEENPAVVPVVAAVGHQESRDAETPEQLASQQGAAKTLNDGLQEMKTASFYLWQQDVTSPQAYRLTRNMAWYGINELPPAVNGQTKILPPPSQVRKAIFDLRDSDDVEALLKAAETRQPEYIFWIDLNRLVAEALDRLGSGYERAHEAVCQETALLMHRLPGLEQLSFADGTPFATSETRQWLQRIAFRSAPSDASPLPPVESIVEAGALTTTARGADVEVEGAMAELHELVHKGQMIEAMELVQQKLRVSPSRRHNMLWRLSMSKVLVETGKSRLALPHLEQVLEDIDRHGLEQYDPDLALRAFKLAWLAFGCQTEDKFKDQALVVLHQIGRLDMPEMVRLTASS